METIKGKGLIGLSVVLISIIWLEIEVSEIQFYGISFETNDEWKIVLALSLSWILFLFRYLQGWGGLNEEFKIAFIKANGVKKVKPLDEGILEVSVNETIRMVGKWEFIKFVDTYPAKRS